VAIKDRLNAIETIQAISNAPEVKRYVEEHLKTKDAKKIMKECETPRTRSHLQTHFNFKSGPALDYHLKPLREADLLRQKIEEDGTIVFEWSNLFRRLPKSTIKAILGDGK
jgi:DNA-binding transcriptional ArsR family regulator